MSKQVLHFFYKPNPFNSRIDYILDFLEKHPLCPEGLGFRKNERLEKGEIGIYYGVEKEATGFYIPAQRIAFNKELPMFSKLWPGKYRFEELLLYSVENKASEGESVFCKNQEFGFDLIEMIFFHITRMEEHHCTADQMDQWDMMKNTEQFLSKHGLHRQPVVDHLVKCFFKALGLKVSKRKTKYRMSHDIDAIEKFPSFYKLLRASFRLLLDNKSWRGQYELWQFYNKVKRKELKDPFDTFDWLLRLCPWEEKLIYFMTGGITRYDNFFNIEGKKARGIIDLAKTYNYKIGIHPSYLAWKREDLFLEELEKLERVVGGEIENSRQHFLHFDFAQTSAIIERQKVKYDSSLAYQDLIGFRCGTGFAYRLYDFKQECSYHFLELPLIIMDTALLWEVDNKVALFEEEVLGFLERNRFDTEITFNFHNSTFDETRLDGTSIKSVYEKICTKFI